MSLPPLMPVEEALERVLAAFEPLEPETVALGDALGRVLAESVVARTTNPPFDASAMDGYAARADDLKNPPVTLDVIGEAGAGHPFSGQLEPGQCVRIFTGAPVPPGADCIVIQEDATRQESADGVRITTGESVPKGRFVRPAGRDFVEGDVLLEAGCLVGPQEIALAGAADVPRLTVRRQPRVALISNGDELVEPGGERRSGQIPASNAIALRALIQAHGGQADDLGIARDSVESIQAVAKRAAGYDLVLTIGGASVGDRDLVQKALAPMGLDVGFWRVAMRPGKPLIFGRLNHIPMLGLPGNPVSALLCGFLFVVPAIRRMLGAEPAVAAPLKARLGAALRRNGPRQAYLRATLSFGDDGRMTATALNEQDSAYLSPLAAADALIVQPPHAEPSEPGEMVEIHVLRPVGGHPCPALPGK